MEPKSKKTLFPVVDVNDFEVIGVEPKGKRKKVSKKENYINFPGTSLSFQQNPTTYYHGIFAGYTVQVTDPKEILDLFESGFFGKGTLSRSKPNFHEFSQEKTLKYITQKRSSGFHRKGMNVPHMEELTDSPPEVLQLALEEAMFLILIGVLKISPWGEDSAEWNEQDWWKLFETLQANFVESFVSYYHYRSQGWVPKCGLKYGVDWILYQKGPSYYHAEKAVIVVNENLPLEPETERSVSWLGLLHWNRVSEQVKKGLTLCIVEDAVKVSQYFKVASNLNLWNWTNDILVEEKQIGRWIPSSCRDKDTI